MGAHRFDQLLQVRQARRGHQLGLFGVAVTKKAQHDSKLVLCGPADRLDRIERRASLLRILSHQASSHACLHGDHGQRMGDDVVQLARAIRTLSSRTD